MFQKLVNRLTPFQVLKRGLTIKKSDNHVDIIITGGGLIGSTLATGLGRHPLLNGKKILLLESSPQKTWNLKPTYSNRVLSVNKNTVQLMKSIGAWSHIVDVRVKEVSSMKVWDCADSSIKFNQDTSDGPISYIVENDVILRAVDKELNKLSNVNVIYKSKAKQYKLSNLENVPVHVIMEDGNEYTCNLLLGADGANSEVRRAMNVQYLQWAYDQSGIVATLHLQKGGKNDTAWQKFLPTGPVALLPLNEDMSSLVWSTTKMHANTLLHLPNDQFVDALNTALREVPAKPQLVDVTNKCVSESLNKLNLKQDYSVPSPPHIEGVEDGSRAAFPLGFGHSVSYVKPSVALIGDSAHKIHPLAGQGVNLGFGDIVCLIEELSKSIQNGYPLGHILALKNYERKRQKHNIPTMVAVDLMARVYASKNPFLMALGSVALKFADSVPPVKRAMMHQGST